MNSYRAINVEITIKYNDNNNRSKNGRPISILAYLLNKASEILCKTVLEKTQYCTCFYLSSM